MSKGIHVSDWRRRTKQKAILYKGGSCIVCGYNRCPAALDFHHVDEATKSFQVSSGACHAWMTMKPELDKCVLLCKICHAEYHYGVLDLEPHLHKSLSIEEGDQALRDAGFDPYYRKSCKKTTGSCVDCGSEIQKKSTRCRSCSDRTPRKTKIDWPEVETLIELVQKTSFVAVARDLGVSDNAIRKRIRTRSDVNPKDLV